MAWTSGQPQAVADDYHQRGEHPARAERNTWIWTTAEALERWHGPEIADSVRHSPGQSALADGWRSVLTDELARVNRVLARLYELELAEDPARRATLRAAQTPVG